MIFWAKVIVSTAVLCFALAVTVEALLNGQGGMWDNIVPAASIVIFCALLCFIGLLEGTQIAAFELLKMPEKEVSQHGVASINCKLLFSGRHFQAFLVGRQILVACLMFVVANIVTISIEEGEERIFGVGASFQTFLNTGLLGALVLTFVGSLAWRIVASSFPLAFMSNPIVYLVIRLCLLVEGTGICSAAYLLALIHKTIVNFQPDEVYIGKLEKEFPKPSRPDRGESFGMSIRRLNVAEDDDVEMNGEESTLFQKGGRTTPDMTLLGHSIYRLNAGGLDHDSDNCDEDDDIQGPARFVPDRGVSFIRGENEDTEEEGNGDRVSFPVNPWGKSIRRLQV